MMLQHEIDPESNVPWVSQEQYLNASEESKCIWLGGILGIILYVSPDEIWGPDGLEWSTVQSYIRWFDSSEGQYFIIEVMRRKGYYNEYQFKDEQHHFTFIKLGEGQLNEYRAIADNKAEALRHAVAVAILAGGA